MVINAFVMLLVTYFPGSTSDVQDFKPVTTSTYASESDCISDIKNQKIFLAPIQSNQAIICGQVEHAHF